MTANKIKENIGNAEQLERLYQQDKTAFVKAFREVYPELADFRLAEFWNIRLEHEGKQERIVSIKRIDILFLLLACGLSGLLIKLPEIFGFSASDHLFYEKNAGIIVFLGLTVYSFLTKNSFPWKHLLVTAGVFMFAALYINLLPRDEKSQSINLAYIHLPLFIWCLYGLVYINFDLKDKSKRIEYIKYNGDLAILGALILFAGMLLAGVTLGLFSAIDIQIENFYMQYIVVWGLVSAPIVATYIMRNYPFVTNKIAPIIASIFSPLVLLTLIIYLITIPIAGKDPYNDRDFLLIFNLMLLGVMGITVFSVSETSLHRKQRFNEWTLFLLSIITLVIDMVALSAIIYRLGEFGFTPNRIAVLGSNLLILGNMIMIMIDLYKVNFKNKEISRVEMTISRYLPIYTAWTIIVVFGFPLLLKAIP